MNLFENRYLLLALKLSLFALLAGFVADRLFIQNDFNTQLQYFIQNIKPNRLGYLLLAVFLMPVNWGIETFKWKILLQSNTSLKILLKSVLAGITVGFVTPGRSGEFIGRVIMLDTDDRTRVFYLSTIGGLAQTAASMIIGVPFVYLWSSNIFLTQVVAGAAAIYLLAFFRFDLLNTLLTRVPFLQRRGLVLPRQHLPVIEIQVQVLLLSIFRFLAYLSQYVFLLLFFGVSARVLLLTANSAVFLLAQTFSPLMPLLDVSYRSSSALIIFKNVTSNNLAVLSTVTLVWLLNLALPAVAGYLLVFRKSNFSLKGLTG